MTVIYLEANSVAFNNLTLEAYNENLQNFGCRITVISFLLWILISCFMDTVVGPILYSLLLVPQIF